MSAHDCAISEHANQGQLDARQRPRQPNIASSICSGVRTPTGVASGLPIRRYPITVRRKQNLSCFQRLQRALSVALHSPALK